VADPGFAYPAPGSGCVLDVRPSVLPAGQVQDLGEHAVGDSVAFELPAGTPGFTIMSQGVNGGGVAAITYRGVDLPNSVVPTDVRFPDGSPFYDDLAAPPQASGYDDFTRQLAYYGVFTPASGAFTVPNTSRLLDQVYAAGALPAGTWRFTVNDFARECATLADGSCTGGSTRGRYHLHVLTRPGPIASTGTLDMDVYLVTNTTLDAATAPADPQVQRWVAGMATVFARAGICLGEVTFHDLPGWARDRWRAVDVDGAGPCDELSQLFTLAAARNAVHVFLVDDLTSPSTGQGLSILGIDGSIPGPSGVPATVNSGTAVSAGDLGFEAKPGACGRSAPFDLASCGTDRIAYVTAHEAGHWLGLYHTAEMFGTLFDPLSDTPTCVCARCAPAKRRSLCEGPSSSSAGAPTLMSASYCAGSGTTCGGGRNLMFWVLDVASRGEITRQQGQVMRLNPAVH
jgi:hypothetical protein